MSVEATWEFAEELTQTEATAAGELTTEAGKPADNEFVVARTEAQTPRACNKLKNRIAKAAGEDLMMRSRCLSQRT